eukprot:5668562-Pleurochrysis_carterae.AAC.1
MRTQGKLHIAIAEAAGREERCAALLAAGTEAAIEAAADDWRRARKRRARALACAREKTFIALF